jgi:hypothetical protein
MRTSLSVKPVSMGGQNPVRLVGSDTVRLIFPFFDNLFHICHSYIVSHIVSPVKGFFDFLADYFLPFFGLSGSSFFLGGRSRPGTLRMASRVEVSYRASADTGLMLRPCKHWVCVIIQIRQADWKAGYTLAVPVAACLLGVFNITVKRVVRAEQGVDQGD